MSKAEEFAYGKYPKDKKGGLYDLVRNSIIQGYHQAEKDVAESFARIIRGNLSMIDKSVQDKFEQLYTDITGEKMYNGFKD